MCAWVCCSLRAPIPRYLTNFLSVYRTLTHSFHAFDLCGEFWLLSNLGPLSHLEFSWSWNKLLNIVQYRTTSTQCVYWNELTHKAFVGVCVVELSSIIRTSSRHDRIYQTICVFASSSFRYISVKEILFIGFTKQVTATDNWISHG